MTPRDLLRQTAVSFRSAGIPDPDTDAALLLSFLLGRPPLSLRLDTETDLPESVLNDYAALTKRRLNREPLQYVVGDAPFLGLLFYVDSRVLIPRPETELLCEWALDLLKEMPSPRILDLCCGSGCIGLSLKSRRPDSIVTLSDCSEDALAVSSENARRLNLDVSLNRGDLVAGLPDQAYDLVISNPPYIPSAACETLQPEVLREPRLALDGGGDGLDLYRRIAGEVPRVLKPGGILLLELGIGESVPVAALLSGAGFRQVAVRQDLAGIDRMIGCFHP